MKAEKLSLRNIEETTKLTTVQEVWVGATPKKREDVEKKVTVVKEFCCLFD